MYKVIKEHAGTKVDTKITRKPRPDLEKYMIEEGYWEKIDPEVKKRKKKVIDNAPNNK
jgi:hypothetical protein